MIQTDLRQDEHAAESPAALVDHLIELPGADGWALWRCACLRGAGFPAAEVLKLAAPALAAAADQLFATEETCSRAFAEALHAVGQALTALGESQDRARRKPLLEALPALKRSKLPKQSAGDASVDMTFERLRQAQRQLDEARAGYERAFVDARAQTSAVIRDIAGAPLFQEAVIWQNARAFRNGVALLLRAGPDDDSRNSQQRQHEELVASYLQRYCAKNDSIGFFGPVGWARFVPDGPSIVAQPGSQLLATRNVYFETWCIDALAETIARDEALLPWLAPRRLPFVHVEKTTLHLPFTAPLTLPALQAAVLHACDGELTAKEIARNLLRNPFLGLKSAEEVYAILTELKRLGRITWSLEVPFELHAERNLRKLLERIEDERLRRPALAMLDELEAARDHVAAAAGSPEALAQALIALEATFTRLTGQSATRLEGKVYAARTLVYEDCRRDLDLMIGPRVREALGQPLELLLTSARWFTCQAAAAYQQIFREIYDNLVRKTGSRVVDFTNFWLQSETLLLRDSIEVIDNILPPFQERWARILDIPADQRHVEYRSADLRPAVVSAFAADGPGWSSALYHSPDVMIAAESVEAILRGEYQLMLGEFHLGANTLSISAFLSQHPAPDELIGAIERDLPPGRRLVPVAPRAVEWRITARTRLTMFSPRDYRLAFAPDACGLPKARTLPVGSLVLEDVDGQLIARTRDRKLSFALIEAFGEGLSPITAHHLKMLAPTKHTPRIAIDRLVVCREAWRFTLAEMPFGFEMDAATRFLMARRWARDQGLPRFVFVGAPVEAKPFFVDFDSPIYVDILSKVLRRSAAERLESAPITLTEMLPRLDQLWLPDAAQQRYTSELRIVVVDRAGR